MPAQISISIIVPIYNVEPYLNECLTSLICQNINNYEVILVNDGSTDNSPEIAQRFSDLHPNIFKFFTKKNGGLSDARNYGLNKAQGEFIAFLDSDDYVSPNMLSILYNATQFKADIICFGMSEVSESGAYLRGIPANSKISSGTYTLSECDNLISSSLPNACNKLFKKSLFTANSIIFPKGLWYEDLAVIPQLFYFANKITYIEDELYFYRKREGAITKTFSLKVMDIYPILTKISDFFETHTKYKNAQHELNTWYINLTSITLARFSAVTNTKEKKAALKKLEIEIKNRFPQPLNIFNCAYSKPQYKIFVLLVRLGLTKLTAIAIKKLVEMKVIKI
ncbi:MULTISPECIES: glycosyltransferase family 2 protein [unclassified Pseudoalteromonas]|uniref:glycosyltransferase family 2 protein n=1 Tax=unclassified Pseudoalteromonas TaxID=194690 RepID=UPI000694A163|nr:MULTISPECIES: glycosyltransferase family 2 protein [unclassified Pseudoalteromonas]